MQLVTPDIGTLFWMLLSFSIVLIILKKFAWKPILKMLKDRENNIDHALKSAKETKLEVEKLKAENEKLMRETHIKAEIMITEAKELSDKIIEDSKLAAEAESDKIIRETQKTIQNEHKAAINQIKKEIAEFSIQISEKILSEELNHTELQEKYINKLVNDINLN